MGAVGARQAQEWGGTVLCRWAHGYRPVLFNEPCFGETPEDVAQAVVWWAAHQDERQEEWIREGFAKKDVHIAMPPSKDDWPKLLRVLGMKSPDHKRPSGKPAPKYGDHLRYNAFRSLRDSGFDPVVYLLDNRDASLHVDMSEGLKAYRSQEAQFTAPVPGTFDFAPRDDWSWYAESFRSPRGVSSSFKVAITLIATLFAAAGIMLIVRSRRHARPLTVNTTGTPPAAV